MAIAKVIEVLAQSEDGWKEATEEALKEAQKTVRNIQAMYVQDMQCDVENGRISTYRVNLKVTFLVE